MRWSKLNQLVVAVILILAGTPGVCKEFNGVKFPDHLDKAETLQQLVDWGYFDEALSWRRDVMKGEAMLTEAEIKKARAAYVEKRARFDLPEDIFPDVGVTTVNFIDGGSVQVVLYCLRPDREITDHLVAVNLTEQVRVMDIKGSVLAEAEVSHECTPWDNVSVMDGPGERFLSVHESGAMAESKHYFHLRDGKLSPVIRIEKSGYKFNLEAVISYHGPGISDSFESNAQKFVEVKGDAINGVPSKVTSTYEWKGSSYVFASESTKADEWKQRKMRH